MITNQSLAIMPLLLQSNEYQVNQSTLGVQFQEKSIRNHGPPGKHPRICMHITEKTKNIYFLCKYSMFTAQNIKHIHS